MIGKSVSTDITTRKKTLPVLYALARSAPLRDLYAGTDADAAFVGRVVPLLEASGARDYTAERARPAPAYDMPTTPSSFIESREEFSAEPPP